MLGLPKPINTKLREIHGKTLYFSNRSLTYKDSEGFDYGRHEIDWMVSKGIVLQTINFRLMVYEFTVSPYY
jgi:hypothetical protein